MNISLRGIDGDYNILLYKGNEFRIRSSLFLKLLANDGLVDYLEGLIGYHDLRVH